MKRFSLLGTRIVNRRLAYYNDSSNKSCRSTIDQTESESNVPELPEVETMRRGILHCKGATIASVKKMPCKKRPIETKPSLASINRNLKGKTIKQIDRWGKRLILRVDDWRLIFEPRMTGLILINEPPTTEHLRIKIELADRDHDIYFWDQRGLGNAILYSPKAFEDRFGNGKLGPDALTITEDELRGNLSKRSLEIKVGLLDQKAVAGIGNIYASEILFLAGVHPQARCNRLSQNQWKLIHQFSIQVLTRAIKYEGSSLGDGTFRTALNDPGQYQNHHTVYDQAGELCSRCRKKKITRIVQAQRSTYFCSACQKKRG